MSMLRDIWNRLRRATGPTAEGPGGPQGAPGESGPGEAGYEGRFTVGDEGGAAEDPGARPRAVGDE